MIDAVAQHYQDALAAVPDDPDAEQIRSEAVAALVRGAQRALRSGAPRGASANYTAAATLTDEPRRTAPALPATRPGDARRAVGGGRGVVGGRRGGGPAGRRLRRGAGPCATGRPPDTPRPDGPGTPPAPERSPGRALSLEGRKAEARDRLTAAVQVLRPEPDRDTVRALSYLAANAASTGEGDADSLTSEALQLGQALDVDGGLLARLFAMRGVFLAVENRLAEASRPLRIRRAHRRTRRATPSRRPLALTNLSDMLLGIDPRAAVDAARMAV